MRKTQMKKVLVIGNTLPDYLVCLLHYLEVEDKQKIVRGENTWAIPNIKLEITLLAPDEELGLLGREADSFILDGEVDPGLDLNLLKLMQKTKLDK